MSTAAAIEQPNAFKAALLAAEVALLLPITYVIGALVLHGCR